MERGHWTPTPFKWNWSSDSQVSHWSCEFQHSDIQNIHRRGHQRRLGACDSFGADELHLHCRTMSKELVLGRRTERPAFDRVAVRKWRKTKFLSCTLSHPSSHPPPPNHSLCIIGAFSKIQLKNPKNWAKMAFPPPPWPAPSTGNYLTPQNLAKFFGVSKYFRCLAPVGHWGKKFPPAGLASRPGGGEGPLGFPLAKFGFATVEPPRRGGTANPWPEAWLALQIGEPKEQPN